MYEPFFIMKKNSTTFLNFTLIGCFPISIHTFTNSIMKSIAVCVTSDLATDNRVLKHADFLNEKGFSVTLIGRLLPQSPPMPEVKYATRRFKLIFNKGPLFYLNFQLRLLRFLVFQRADIIWANDIDTITPCWMVSRIFGKTLVFDAHELFTEVPELEKKSLKKSIWGFIEKTFASRADVFITVNSSIAHIYNKKYKVYPYVIRNVPKQTGLAPAYSRRELGVPEDCLFLVLQGSGINLGRGLSETLLALQNVENIVLFVIGGGTAIGSAKELCERLPLQTKVRFIDRLPYSEMMRYTQAADVGLAYDAHECLNFKLALPNKIFDFFQAGIAIIGGPQPEISALIQHYNCGYIMQGVHPDDIASTLQLYQKHPEILLEHKANSKKASLTEHWDTEKQKLEEVIAKLN